MQKTHLNSLNVSKYLILIIMTMFILYGCGKTEKDIDGYINSGNLDAIITFIQKSIKNKDTIRRRDLVKYAVEKLAITKDTKAIEFLESLFYFRPKDIYKYKEWYLDDDIINSFIQNSLTFPDFKRLCDRYIDIRKWSSQSQNIEKMLCMYEKIENYQYYYQQIEKTFKKATCENYEEILRKIPIENHDKVLSKVAHTNKVDGIQTWLENTNKQLEQKIYSQVKGDYPRHIKQETNHHALLEAEIQEKQKNWIKLRGYIVAQISDEALYKVYEISFNSGEHAILLTNDTVFSSKGWFNMFVEHAGKEQVSVEGGFKPLWNVYREVRKKSLEKVETMKNDLKESISRFNNKEKQLKKLFSEKA